MLRMTGGLLAATLLLAPAPARAQRPACEEGAYRAYAKAQRAFQRELAAAASARDPDARPAVELLRDLQLALIDAREYAALRLLRQTPRALHLDRPINQWLDWGARERDSLAAVDPRYAALTRRAAALEQALLRAADVPRAQAAGRQALSPAAQARLASAAREATARCR